MKGNFYGIDIKLTPENKPYLIEANGRHSGTTGFIMAYGDLRTQKAILSAMSSYSNGKPIYRTSEIKDPDERLTLKRLFLTTLGKGATILNEIINRRALDLKQDYIRKPYEEKHKENGSEIPKNIYQKSAQELGINFNPYKTLKLINPKSLRVKHESGDYEDISLEDIGIIWGNPKVFSETNEFNDVLANPYILERLLNTKLYIHRLLENSELAGNMPKSVPYGMGILHNFPAEIISRDKVVYKPNSASGGRGVRVCSPRTLEKFINPEIARKANNRLKQFFSTFDGEGLGKIKKGLVEAQLDSMEAYSYLIQEFISSKPIESSETGLNHDSCIRAIVFDGKFIDAYHRLSPTPLVSKKETSTKYIGNLHYGALAEPVSDKDLPIVSEFVENVVRTLEQRIENSDIRTEGDFEQFRKRFWVGELENVA